MAPSQASLQPRALAGFSPSFVPISHSVRVLIGRFGVVTAAGQTPAAHILTHGVGGCGLGDGHRGDHYHRGGRMRETVCGRRRLIAPRGRRRDANVAGASDRRGRALPARIEAGPSKLASLQISSPMNSTPPLLRSDLIHGRPDGVWVIFILFWTVFLFSAGNFVLTAPAVLLGRLPGTDGGDLLAAALMLLLGGMGTLRLLWLKADACLYFTAATVTSLVNQIMTLIGVEMVGKARPEVVFHVAGMAATLVVWGMAALYAYRVGNRRVPPRLAAAMLPERP
jgi:hypothetical protein